MGKPRFGRVPDTVGADKQLSHCDVHVYWGLARAAISSSAVVNVGVRLLAATCNCSEKQVRISLKRLAERRHIQIQPREVGSRASYLITSMVFKPRRQQEEVVWQSGGMKITKTKSFPAKREKNGTDA